MSKPAFTPGPWRAVFADHGGYDAMTDAFVIENAEGKEIAALDLYHYGQKHCADGYEARKKAEPIAARIAAAPGLLEALGQALEWIHEYESYISDSDRTAWLDKADKLVKILEG